MFDCNQSLIFYCLEVNECKRWALHEFIQKVSDVDDVNVTLKKCWNFVRKKKLHVTDHCNWRLINMNMQNERLIFVYVTKSVIKDKHVRDLFRASQIEMSFN